MSYLSRWLIVGCAFMALATPHAWGQAPEGGRRGGPGMMMGGGMMGGGGTVGLLAMEAVQKELELVDDQKQKLKALAEEARKEMGELFGGMRDLSPEDRQAKFAELRPKMEAKGEELSKKANEILLPHQQARLKELRVQRLGPAALGDPKIQEELKITEEQKGKLQKIREKVDELRRNAMPKGTNFRDMSEDDRAKLRERFEGVRKAGEDAVKEAMGVLTSEQSAAFEKMQGKKFEFPPQQGRGPGGRGPGGPGGERRPNN